MEYFRNLNECPISLCVPVSAHFFSYIRRVLCPAVSLDYYPAAVISLFVFKHNIIPSHLRPFPTPSTVPLPALTLYCPSSCLNPLLATQR